MQQATDLKPLDPRPDGAPPEPRRTKKQARLKQNLIGWAFVAPTVLFVIAFIYYGIFYNAYHSLFSWDGISFEKTYIGFENFARMFQDPEFYNALKNTGIFTVLTVTIQAGLGLVLAYLLHTKGMGGRFSNRCSSSRSS